MKEITEEKIPPYLEFRPWPIGDSVTQWLVNQVDKTQLVNLAKVGLELNHAVLQAQLKANTQMLEIVSAIQR